MQDKIYRQLTHFLVISLQAVSDNVIVSSVMQAARPTEGDLTNIDIVIREDVADHRKTNVKFLMLNHYSLRDFF